MTTNQIAKFGCRLAVTIGAAVAPFVCHAAWPERPIKLITGFAPGGGADGVARALSDAMSKKLGTPVIVENRPGAGTTVAATFTARAPADGYTLMLLTTTNTISPSMYKSLPYKADSDFTLIGSVAKGPMVIAVSKESGITSLSQLLEKAKKDPGKIDYGAGGVGTTPHLAALVLEKDAGIKMTNIPYKGGSETSAALIGNQIQAQFGTPPAVAPIVGRANILAVTTARKSDLFPGVPTVAETVKGYDVSSWYGVGGPAGIPADVVQKISTAIEAAVADPALKKHLTILGLEPFSSTPQVTKKMYLDELKRWSSIVSSAGLTAD